MHILITSDIFPPDVGGPATYVPMIARELTRRGHSVRVLTYSSTSSDAADAASAFKIERIMVGGSRLRRLSRAFVRIAANAWRAEILYVNGLLVETALVNLLLRKPAVAKVVGDLAWERARDKAWITDGFETFQRRWYGWRVELRRALRTWALSQMRAVIVPSVYLREAVIGWRIDGNRVHVVPNALEPFADDPEPEVLPLTTKHRLITICRLTGWKGVDGIIEAIDALPDVGLVVVGDGPEYSALEALARQLGVTDRICFVGRVARERIGGYLGACDVFVLNSRYEGLPHAVLEAMAAGLPVVATRAGGIGEAVEDGVNGHLVEPGDVDGLRRAITETLEDADLRARCQAAKLEIGRRFSRDVMVQATERVLKEAREVNIRMNWKGHQVLITGAGGFIGSHLAERLVELGARVRGFVRYTSRADVGLLRFLPPAVLGEIECVFGDLRDADAVRRAAADCRTVFHLGALISIPYSYVHPREVVETNVLGTLNVLEAAREGDVERVVHTSTSEVYGTAQYVPIDEKHPLQGQSPYSASKIGADRLVESFWRSFDLPVVTVRPFNTYGPRQSARAVIPTIITQALTQDEVRLGNLLPTRDFTFVTDTVAGLVDAAEATGVVGQEMNLGTGHEIAIGDLAAKIIAMIGQPVRIVTEDVRLRPSTSEVERLLSDDGRAKQLIGWSPQITLDEGLQLTIAWIREHLDLYRPGVYEI